MDRDTKERNLKDSLREINNEIFSLKTEIRNIERQIHILEDEKRLIIKELQKNCKHDFPERIREVCVVCRKCGAIN